MVQQKSEEGETGKRKGEDFRGGPEENDGKEKIQEMQLTEILSKTWLIRPHKVTNMFEEQVE